MFIRFILIFALLSTAVLAQQDYIDTPLPIGRYAQQQRETFQDYINTTMTGVGLETFDKVANEVKNNIFWTSKGRKNKYQDAFERSYPFISELYRDDIPSFMFLIPSLESTWDGTRGSKEADYGYWQMVPFVVEEIKKLDHVSDRLRLSSPDQIRSDPDLSTEAALIHLERYYFYFRHVANLPERDAWLFSAQAFNWGSGNIKAVFEAMNAEGQTISFSSFYRYLYEASLRNPDDKSMRVALEYVPNLWNIARLVDQPPELRISSTR